MGTKTINSLLKHGFLLESSELRPVLWSFLYFFCLLSGYYLLRPLREEMGIQSGVENLPWLFTATFVVMILVVPVFGKLTGKFPRRKFIPYIYVFFILNILAFYILFTLKIKTGWVARIFFVWLSVYNLFVVSVFWSFMADIFSREQSKRVFGLIAAGGSAGAVTGPLLTMLLVTYLGPVNLLLISAGMLLIATVAIFNLMRMSKRISTDETPFSGSVFDGIKTFLSSKLLFGIGIIILLYSIVSTFLYFEQAHIIANAFQDSAQRTQVFSIIDFGTNTLAISMQFFFTGRILRNFGIAISLCLIPLIVSGGLVVLSQFAIIPAIVIIQIIHRAGNFSLSKPAREVLFTDVPIDEKYRAKNFIDTAVFRGGDALTGWAFAGLISLGLGIGAIALIGAPIAAIWALISFKLGSYSEKPKIVATQLDDVITNK